MCTVPQLTNAQLLWQPHSYDNNKKFNYNYKSLMEISTDTNRHNPLIILVNIPRILLLLSYSVQAAFLDYFLIQYYDFLWFLWLIPDFFILGKF